ncbi:MAG TPA: hypothetical protein VGA09_20660 [Candidatus Binatia bacterium]
MARGRKTGGRKKGSLNKRTREIELSRNGLLPLDYMLGVKRDEKADPYRRHKMAKAAAPVRSCQACAERQARADDSGSDLRRSQPQRDPARGFSVLVP